MSEIETLFNLVKLLEKRYNSLHKLTKPYTLFRLELFVDGSGAIYENPITIGYFNEEVISFNSLQEGIKKTKDFIEIDLNFRLDSGENTYIKIKGNPFYGIFVACQECKAAIFKWDGNKDNLVCSKCGKVQDKNEEL